MIEIESEKIEAVKTAIEDLFMARSLYKLSFKDWQKVAAAYHELTGEYAEWRTHGEMDVYLV
jgi:hypothetical protein